MLNLSSGMNFNSLVQGKADGASQQNKNIPFGRKKDTSSNHQSKSDFKNVLRAESSAKKSSEVKSTRADQFQSKTSSAPVEAKSKLPGRPEPGTPLPPKSFDEVKPVAGWENRGSTAPQVDNSVEKAAEWPVDVGVPGKVDPLTRRAAMQGFLRKMEDELGIDASQIVAAFSQLSAAELMAPPEETVGRVLDQMGLEGERRGKALFLFQDMLKQSSSSNMAEYLKGSDRQLSLEVLSRSEARKKRISESIDKMSKNFFVDNQAVAKEGQNEGTSNLAAGAAMGTAADGTLSSGAAQPGAAAWGAKPSTMAASAGWGAAGSDVAQGFSQQMGAGAQVLPEGMEAVVEPAAMATDQIDISSELAESATDGGQDSGIEELVTNKSTGNSAYMDFDPEVTSELESILGKANIQNAANASGGSTEAGEAAAAASMGMASQENDAEGDGSQLEGQTEFEMGPQGKTGAESLGKGDFVAAAPKMNKTQETQNVREVIDQAQVMVRNGGGKMKIKMSPEGMGEVTLKVATEGGRVNIEMIASNSDTKRLLEKGLGDLKETLASHKLNVDLVKVGSAEQTSKHMDQQLQDQQQRFAQQFMNEFRHGNQSFREGFVGLPGIRNYKSQTQDDASNQGLTPHQIKARKSARRLDLVA